MWIRLVTNVHSWTSYNIFSIHFGSASETLLIIDLKQSQMLLFGSNLIQIQAKSYISDVEAESEKGTDRDVNTRFTEILGLRVFV